MKNNSSGFGRFQFRVHEIIFGTDTWAGKWFDILLIVSIIASITVVMLDSVAAFSNQYNRYLYRLEWGFTLLFTIEYILRLICVKQPLKYAFSFLGMVDLFSILPTYLSLFVPGSQYLMVIRVLRVLRVFRVFKLVSFMGEASTLVKAMQASRRKIIVFLMTVLTLVIIFGSLMYLIEGAQNGFTSIPRSIYWAIVTMTTVGYGDISPKTGVGQSLASIIMILGYAIIAVPTGIVSAELSLAAKKEASKQIPTQAACPECVVQGHDDDAIFCRICSAHLNPKSH